MHITNMNHVPGYRIQQALGLCIGNTIRAKHVGPISRPASNSSWAASSGAKRK